MVIMVRKLWFKHSQGTVSGSQYRCGSMAVEQSEEQQQNIQVETRSLLQGQNVTGGKILEFNASPIICGQLVISRE